MNMGQKKSIRGAMPSYPATGWKTAETAATSVQESRRADRSYETALQHQHQRVVRPRVPER